jgi:hypothetical protein
VQTISYRASIIGHQSPESFLFARLTHVGDFYFIALGKLSFKDSRFTVVLARATMELFGMFLADPHRPWKSHGTLVKRPSK